MTVKTMPALSRLRTKSVVRKTEGQSHSGEACKPGWSASRTGCVPAGGGGGSSSNTTKPGTTYGLRELPQSQGAAKPGLLSRLAGGAVHGIRHAMASLFKQAFYSLSIEQSAPPQPVTHSGSYGHHTKNVADRLAGMGVKDAWSTNLQTSPELRATSITNPMVFDRNIQSIVASLKSAVHFAETPEDSARLKNKLGEVEKLANDVNSFRARNSPERPSVIIDGRIDVTPPKPKPPFGKKGSGAANTLVALEHLAKGGTPKGAVQEIMKYGDVKEATAERHVRRAIKITADKADKEIARLKALVAKAKQRYGSNT